MKNESVTTSNKIPFSVTNLKLETLALSPSLYTRAGMPNREWTLVDKVQSHVVLGASTTEVRSNLYDLKVPYISESTLLEITNSGTQGIFHLEKIGNDVTYTSASSQGSVYINYYWDIATNVTLVVGDLEQASDTKSVELHEENGIQYLISGGLVDNAAAHAGEKSIVVPDSTYFSFTTNTNMYFSIVDNPSAVVYQKIGEKLVKTYEKILYGYASSGGLFALSNNESMLYPAGISTLRINDGFSESMAEIEFNRNASDRTIKISVKSHTSRICELNGSKIVFAL